MTCIVGVAHERGVTMGADSAGVSGHNLTIRADEKLFTVGPYLLGFTSSFRMGQILRYKLTTPNPPMKLGKLDEFMATEFVDAVRSTLLDGGYLKTDNGRIEGGTFLVATRGRLYGIHDDLQVSRSAAGYDAVGSGGNIAVGSLHTSGHLGKNAAQRVRMALAASAAWNSAVAPPFRIRTQQAVPS